MAPPIPPPLNLLQTGTASAPLFDPYYALASGSWPEAVAIGDVNADGRDDVLMTTSFYFDPVNDYKLFIFLQTANGTLAPPIKYPTGGSYTARPASLDLGDLNHDGRLDVVVGNGRSSIEVFLQGADGTLSPSMIYPSVHSTRIKIADLNNDGRDDVAGIAWGGGSAAVFLQNLDGTLDAPATYYAPHGGYDDLDVGDINNDGLTDIVVMSGQGYAYDNLAILTQNPEGSFDPVVFYDLGGNELTRGVAVGDVNGDGADDVVVSHGGNRPNSKIGVFYQVPEPDGPSLAPAVNLEAYDIPEPVTLADLNGDGRLDIATAHGGWMQLGVYLQQADGSLAAETLYPIPYASHYNPQGLVLGDINGDGLPDAAIADYNHGLVILPHGMAPPAPLP